MTKPNGNGNGKDPQLPRWFALRGPRPYWLAEHWSLILAVLTAVVVFINTVIFPNLPSAISTEWLNAAMAWLAALALYLKDRQGAVNRIAAWRRKIRNEEPPKGT